jgi:esterase/lipase superfamily enzyme
MECKVYGHSGHPVLFIPCQDGRFFDFENFHMTDVWASWIESGRVMVCAVDTIDKETWSNKGGDPRWRIVRHEKWMRYLSEEAAPFIKGLTGGEKDVIAFGCSLGATHAVNLYFRYPDIFGGLLALSGIYTADYGFDGYMDDLVYLNSPVHYLANMPKNHPYIAKYNQNKAVICVGQGPWEVPDSTRQLQAILNEKGITAWVDYWGYDCAHDWDWWYKQVTYFVPHLL